MNISLYKRPLNGNLTNMAFYGYTYVIEHFFKIKLTVYVLSDTTFLHL